MKVSIGILSLAVFSSACGVGTLTGWDGGSSTDAGNVDAGDDGGFDAGTDGGLIGACPYRYCEDFESYDAGAVTNGELLGPWKATVSGMGITASVDSVNPRSGSKSFHVTVPADAGTRGTLNQRSPSGLVPGNNIFGRVEIFYSDAGSFGLPLAVHSWVFSASGLQEDGGASNMNMGGGGTKVQLNYHWPNTTAEQNATGGVMTTGVWHCLQWQFDGSGEPPANMAKVWLDGALVVSVPATMGWTFPAPWNNFDFGFNHYQALSNPVDIYVDDFALDGTMIPCP